MIFVYKNNQNKVVLSGKGFILQQKYGKMIALTGIGLLHPFLNLLIINLRSD